MTAAEFARIRLELGWSGLYLAKVLGVGHSSPSRWEAGDAPVSESIAKLMLLLKHFPEVREYLEEQLAAPPPRGRPRKALV